MNTPINVKVTELKHFAGTVRIEISKQEIADRLLAAMDQTNINKFELVNTIIGGASDAMLSGIYNGTRGYHLELNVEVGKKYNTYYKNLYSRSNHANPDELKEVTVVDTRDDYHNVKVEWRNSFGELCDIWLNSKDLILVVKTVETVATVK